MNEPIDEQYFVWLYSQIGSVKTRTGNRTHWQLLKQLHEMEFSWFIPNDDNRVEDGKDLRDEFFRENNVRGEYPEWEGLECSFLEMLIALSRRLSFEADGEPRWWFWHLLENLELTRWNDAIYDIEEPSHWIDVEEKAERVINRTYDYYGNGGLFPLDNPSEDQTQVEIWYQLSAYIIEREEG